MNEDTYGVLTTLSEGLKGYGKGGATPAGVVGGVTGIWNGLMKTLMNSDVRKGNKALDRLNQAEAQQKQIAESNPASIFLSQKQYGG
jgi:hypothetical protein